MTIKKSKVGNIYFTLENVTERKWAEEKPSLEIGKDGKFAYIHADKIETIDEAASLFRMMNTITKYDRSSATVSTATEAVGLINARALEIKNTEQIAENN